MNTRKQDKENYSEEEELNIENINQPIESTAVIARKSGEKWIGTIGNYKVTEEYLNWETLADSVINEGVSWRMLLAVTNILAQGLEKNNAILQEIKENNTEILTNNN